MIEKELTANRSLLDGELGNECNNESKWEEVVDLVVLCRFPPIHSMEEAAPWLLQLKHWKESNLLSETKIQEVAQKVKRGVENVTLVSVDQSVDSGFGGFKTQMRPDREETQAAQQISSAVTSKESRYEDKRSASQAGMILSGLRSMCDTKRKREMKIERQSTDMLGFRFRVSGLGIRV